MWKCVASSLLGIALAGCSMTQAQWNEVSAKLNEINQQSEASTQYWRQQQYVAPQAQSYGQRRTLTYTFVGGAVVGSNGVTYRQVGSSFIGTDGSTCQITSSYLIC